MTEPRNLARSKDGLTIHRATCRHARAPWYGADPLSDDELLDVKLRLGYRVCRDCKPSFRRRASK
jgi:hypothetical protein